MATNRRVDSEVSELENAFQDLAKKNAEKKTAKSRRAAKKKLIAIILVCVFLAIILMAVAAWLLYVHWYNTQPITANVSIAGVDLQGVTREDAEAKINATLMNEYTFNSMSVILDDHTIRIPSSVANITLDVPAAVDAAIRCQQAGEETQPLDLSAYMTINKDGIMQELAPLLEFYTSTLTQHTYEIVGDAPVEVTKPDETTILQQLVITTGTPGIHLDLEDLYQNVLDAYNDGVFGVTYTVEVTEPDPLDLNAIYEATKVLPVNAEMDKETFDVLGGFYGYDFDVDAAAMKLDRAGYSETVQVSFRWIEPEITAEQLAAVLFRDTLASYTTKAGSVYDRNINLKLACQAINGMILYPGDVFSYNQALGERTTDKGYRPGVSYIGGESVMDIGGGICQVSSTLYYCAVVADLKIVERWNHAYASAYTPLSTDATVFWGGVDFRFENNTEYPIRIEASSNYGNVTVKLIGTDTKDYYVKFVSERLEVIPYEEEYRDFEENNEKGYKDGDVIVTPYTGYVSKSYRVKYDKETDKKIESTLECYDRYASRNKVIARVASSSTPPESGDQGGDTSTETPTPTPDE